MICLAIDGGATEVDDVNVLQRVQVTGSHIPRTDGESALPVQIIRRDEIERSGVQSVEQLLGQVSANLSPTVLAQSVGSGLRPGYSAASLRGLAPRATLVLIDGRRLSNYGIAPQVSGGVDLHAIPLEAIEQVEVLKDGASAIYGSDAIGGVINFILRKNEQGASASAFHGQAEAGGAAETRMTGTAGHGDLAADGYNVFVVADYQRTSGLNAKDRPFSTTGYRPDLNLDRTTTDSYPANVQTGGRTLNPFAPDCPAHTVFVRGNCAFDPTSLNDLLPPTERASVIGRAVLQATPSLQLVAEGLFDRNRVRSNVSPSPVGSDVVPASITFVLPPSSPFYPKSLGVTGNLGVRYEALPLGPRVSETVAAQSRILLGAQGTWQGWSYDTALLFNESKVTYRYLSGYVDARAASAAFATGLVNPFGDSGPAGDALLAATQVSGIARTGNALSRGLDFRATRDLFVLPAGTVSLAVGVEARRDSLDGGTAPFAAAITAANVSIGAGGKRSTKAAYAEAVIPIVRTVEAQLALREDRYSDFGSTLNPKVALRWQPVRSLVLRASYGRGFRAPALNELYTQQADQFTTVQDPVRCPVTGATADCSDAIAVRAEGNPALKPERSEQSSAGFVFAPDDRFSASVDFWRVRIADQIGILSTAIVLANDSAYEGTHIVRAPADPANPTLPGRIVTLLLPDENVGLVTRRGVDVELAWRSAATAYGRLGAKLSATYLQGVSGLPIEQRAVYEGGVLARWQHYAAVEWDYGAFATTVHESLQSGYRDAKLGPGGVARHVGAWDVWGAQVAWSGFRNAKLAIGVENLLGRPPPVSNQSDFFQSGYAPQLTDPRGRSWYMKLGVRFR